MEKEKEEYLLEADRAIAAIEAEIRAREDEVARIVIDPALKESERTRSHKPSPRSLRRIDGQRSEEAALRKEAGALDEALRRIAESEDEMHRPRQGNRASQERDLRMDHRGESARERRHHRP